MAEIAGLQKCYKFLSGQVFDNLIVIRIGLLDQTEKGIEVFG